MVHGPEEYWTCRFGLPDRKFTKIAARAANRGHGMAVFRATEELRQQLLRMATFQQCQTGLTPPLDEQIHTLVSGKLTQCMRVNWMRPVFTTAK